MIETTSASPIATGGVVGIPASKRGEKIIQRIRSAAGSNLSETHSMAGADDDLVLQCRNGSADAFEILVQRHQKMIHGLTYRMTGSMADAEDLAQEAFIRAYEQIGSFNGKAKFATWLYSIAVHGCLNWRRDEARRFRAESDCAREMRMQGDENSSPEKNIVQEAQEALMKLPAKQRAAIVLTVCDGLSHAEASRILKCSETTISWRVFSAKRKLKKLLTRMSDYKVSYFNLPAKGSLDGVLEI